MPALISDVERQALSAQLTQVKRLQKRDNAREGASAAQELLCARVPCRCSKKAHVPQVAQQGSMNRHNGSSPSVNSGGLEEAASNSSSRQLFAHFKSLLEAAEAKVAGYDELRAMLQSEQRSVGQLERALQQRHIDRFTAQDLLVSQLTQQLTAQSQAVEQLRNTCRQHTQQLENCQAYASALQQEVGQKRKRIDSLMDIGEHQEKKLTLLEKKLQQYRSLCSYVATESQVKHIAAHALGHIDK